MAAIFLDTITFSYSEEIDPSSIVAGWDGTGSQALYVVISDDFSMPVPGRLAYVASGAERSQMRLALERCFRDPRVTGIVIGKQASRLPAALAPQRWIAPAIPMPTTVVSARTGCRCRLRASMRLVTLSHDPSMIRSIALCR